jgi:hypothetical protein
MHRRIDAPRHGSAANLDPITRFKGHKDGTELQRVLRLNDMMDTKSEEVEAKSAQIEEVEEAIRRRQQQEGIEYEQAPSPLNPWVIGSKPGKEGPCSFNIRSRQGCGRRTPCPPHCRLTQLDSLEDFDHFLF